MHCGITFRGENFCEWLNPHDYEAVNKFHWEIIDELESNLQKSRKISFQK